MVISELLRPEHVLITLRPQNKARLLKSLSEAAAAAVGLDIGVVHGAIEGRENLGSTGVGQGVAIPHARIPGLKTFFALFARLPKAIEFAAVDGKPVDLVFLLLIPEGAGTEHLAALACVSRMLRDKAVADRLRAARTAKDVYALLTESL